MTLLYHLQNDMELFSLLATQKLSQPNLILSQVLYLVLVSVKLVRLIDLLEVPWNWVSHLQSNPTKEKKKKEEEKRRKKERKNDIRNERRNERRKERREEDMREGKTEGRKKGNIADNFFDHLRERRREL